MAVTHILQNLSRVIYPLNYEELPIITVIIFFWFFISSIFENNSEEGKPLCVPLSSFVHEIYSETESHQKRWILEIAP